MVVILKDSLVGEFTYESAEDGFTDPSAKYDFSLIPNDFFFNFTHFIPSLLTCAKYEMLAL